MDDGVPSISEFLQMRAWKHALFTTYTLSLSYFESEILPPLLRAACSDVWLIADAEGYRSSLLERRSMRVGQEYRLIPVTLPNGVFHAKSIYLGSDEGDLILVGSGNVTFAGHGRNLEIFEALSPDIAASAFVDFADYLEALGSRPDVSFARSEWIDDFAARARLAAERGSDQVSRPPLRLIHSLDQPILDQLPDFLSSHGACSAATIMSPYYDPDGLAVKRLSEAFGGMPVSVAVTNPIKSPFPFENASAWPFDVSAVRLKIEDTRFAHAKLYEFRCEEQTVLLTGSINATRKALTTTDNVELGVLRCLQKDSETLDWQPIATPGFEPQDRMPSGLNENEIVFASFDRNNSSLLTGQVFSLRSPEGTWAGWIIQADGEVTMFEVLTDQRGKFTHSSIELERFSEMPALQIVMTMGDREARGWVHNEMFLSMPGRRRLTAGSLSRLMRREGSDDDIEALLDYLSIQAENHLRIFDQPVQDRKQDGNEDGRSKDLVTVNIADLAPVASISEGAAQQPGVPSQRDTFDIAMERLRRIFLGQGRSKIMAAHRQAETIVAEEELADNEHPEQDSEALVYKLGLSDFEDQIARLIKEAQDKPNVVRALLVMSLEVGMWMRIYRLNDTDSAHEFLQSWFFKACRLAKPVPDKLASIEQHVLTAAATMFDLVAETENASAVAVGLHDGLERFYGGAVDLERTQSALMPDSHIGFAELLSGSVEELQLSTSLAKILSHKTIRQQLLDAMALADQGKSIPSDWEVFQSPVGAELQEALQSENWRRRVKFAGGASKACAFDNFMFSADVAAKYERYRIGRCIHCKKFTLAVTP